MSVDRSGGLGTRINEADVILNRAGLHSLSDEDREMSKAQIRMNTTLPEVKIVLTHLTEVKRKKFEKNLRRVNKQVSEEIYQEFQVSVPIGSGMYNKPIFKLFSRKSPIFGN